MTVINCKMCGGNVELSADKTFGTCEFCGSVMTLPKVSDEQRAALFNRGNYFRRKGDFDTALAVYENIVREDDTDAEAHWCCVLCRYGIEYVEDPASFTYVPTCHRASFDSILEDVDYLAALEHSDGVTRRQYQRDAVQIAEVQRAILATSQHEEPFDVFICYKDTDDDTNERTRDSIDAQEIYYQLTQAGYRVFFSRITLEDKAGAEYEPYIFAALHSAKVMLVIGSKPEYFKAEWVKNEWSRYLALMKKDRTKLMLPCYRGMNPQDMPEQLTVLQSYDMTKIGFVQDLLHGVKKVLSKAEESVAKDAVAIHQLETPDAASLLKRAWILLRDRDWDKADEYFDKVLDIDPEYSEAYAGKFCAKKQYTSLDEIEKPNAELGITLNNSKDWQNAIRYKKPPFADTLDGHIMRWQENTYQELCEKKEIAEEKNDLKALETIADAFKNLSEYRNAKNFSENCQLISEQCLQLAADGACLKAQRLSAEFKQKENDINTKIEELTQKRDNLKTKVPKTGALVVALCVFLFFIIPGIMNNKGMFLMLLVGSTFFAWVAYGIIQVITDLIYNSEIKRNDQLSQELSEEIKSLQNQLETTKRECEKKLSELKRLFDRYYSK